MTLRAAFPGTAFLALQFGHGGDAVDDHAVREDQTWDDPASIRPRR